MKKSILSLLLSLSLINLVNAQTVATIAVADITVSAKSASSLSSNQDLAQALSEGLLTALKETRKFSLLSNAELTTRLTDQRRNVQGYYDKSYKGEQYLQVGLDYILTADVTEFSVSQPSSGSMKVDLKLHGVADVTADFNTSASVRLGSANGSNKDASAKAMNSSDDLLALGVEELTERVSLNLFPVRVIKLNEDASVSLNYGAGLFSVGDTVLVYPLQEDAPLNQAGSPSGNPIATLQVTNTDKKFATARAVDGFDQLVKGQKAVLLGNDG